MTTISLDFIRYLPSHTVIVTNRHILTCPCQSYGALFVIITQTTSAQRSKQCLNVLKLSLIHIYQALSDKAWYNNYYHTGDTAYRDADGFFWYVGRTDDLIKSSGYRIGPFEIESVLMEHPAVLECAITGVPDPVRGQIVKATIVLTTKYSPSDELAKEIQDYVKKSTAPYKYPRIIEFVTELPKTISGKIRRVEIREKDSIK